MLKHLEMEDSPENRKLAHDTLIEEASRRWPDLTPEIVTQKK